MENFEYSPAARRCDGAFLRCWESPFVAIALKHLKKVERRNQACLDLEQLRMKIYLALSRARQRLALIRSFFENWAVAVNLAYHVTFEASNSSSTIG